MIKPPRSVLVIVTRRIGDVLLATPVMHSLKRAWPEARIDVLVFAGTEGVIVAHPDISTIHTIAECPNITQHIVLINKIFRRYDLALSLVPGDRPTLYAWLAGKTRAGLLLATRKEAWKRRLLDLWVPYDLTTLHMVRTHLALLAPLDVAPIAEVGVTWQAEDERTVKALLAPLASARYAVLHLHPKFNYKMWRDTGWLELAQWLHARGLRIVLTGSNDPSELEYINKLTAQMQGDPLNLAGQLTLSQAAYAISRAVAYVGPDTALTHMAAALGTPTVALFGPTNPVKWGPWPKGYDGANNPWRRLGNQRVGNVCLLQGDTACVPCGHEGCGRRITSFSDCLLNIPIKKVTDALATIAGIF